MDNYQYQQYLKSDEWKQKARQRAEIDDFKCCMCGATGTMNNPLETHHLSYRAIGRENVWKDILTLCHNCHYHVHLMMNQKTAPDRRGWKDELRIADHVLYGEPIGRAK